MPLPEGVRTHNQAYLDGWENGRCAMIEEFEAVALHWEREVGGGQERMREGARWLRTAINKVRQGENYDGCEHQGPDPWERLAVAERKLGAIHDKAGDRSLSAKQIVDWLRRQPRPSLDALAQEKPVRA